jgi:Ca-activated chloride channel family protein
VVSEYRLVGYENRAIADQDFRNDRVAAAEIGAGRSATAIYAVRLRPGAQGRIATLQLRWEDPDSRQVREINGNFNTFDLASAFDHTAPHFQLAVTAAEFAEFLRRSPYSEGVSLYQIRDLGMSLARKLPGNEKAADFAALLDRAARIDALISDR